MNTCVFTGRLTADVELKSTQNGVPVCSFTLAVKRPRRKDVTDFINFVAWRNTAEFISKYFHKGSMIACKGSLTARKYQDANGNNRVAFEIEVDDAEFCESKKDGTTSDTVPDAVFEDLASDEELPFG